MGILHRNSTPNQPSIQPPSRKRWKFFVWGVLVLFLGVVGWVGISGYLAFRDISSKNASDQSSFFKFNGDIPPSELKTEGDSRINLVSLGVDAAAGLTDSIEIISIDPINNTLSMISIPRDTYVMNPAENRKTKINEVYNSGLAKCERKPSLCDSKVDGGAEAVKQVIKDNFGVSVQYFAKADFEGLKSIVNIVGGVQIYVDKPINDPKYPNKTNTGYDPFKISAGMQNMNGEIALKYARSRQTTSDFDRARRQQQVISAIKAKLLSLNILANPKKITDVLNSIGKHFKTDLTSGEMITLAKAVEKLDNSKATSKVLNDSPEGPFRSSTNGVGQYVLIPKLGENDWSQVKDFVTAALPEPYLIKEAASISIEDASGKSLGTALESKLKKLGYKVTTVTKLTTVSSSSTLKFASDSKPYTLALLKKRLSLTASKDASIAADGTDIIIRIGSSFVLK